MSVRVRGARSTVIAGQPLIYLSDPLGHSFACVTSMRDYELEYGVNFKQIEVADMAEVRELHKRFGVPIALADRLWWRVEAD